MPVCLHDDCQIIQFVCQYSWSLIVCVMVFSFNMEHTMRGGVEGGSSFRAEGS